MDINDKEIIPPTPEKSPRQSFVVEVEAEEKPINGETDDQMTKRKELVMLMSLKRRAELEAKKAIKQNELARIREQAAIEKEKQELKKLEYKQRREAILEQYRQKKKIADAAEKGDSLPGCELKSSGSVTNLASAGNQNGSRHMKSSQSHHKSAWTLYTGPKLFAKPTTKTNLILIQNAILKALEGAANAKTLSKMQETISAHSKTCPHFLILFRSRHQFRGLYEYDEKQNTITKLEGIGPKSINNEDIVKYYKFDSPKRQFTEVQTRTISLTIIAVTIQDHLWCKTLSSRVSTHDLVHHQQPPQQQLQRNGH